MSELIATQWRNNNERVKYPFGDDATLTNDDGITINEDLFDDARVYPVGGSVGLYLSRITVTDGALTFYVADPVTGDIASGGFQFDAPTPDNIALRDSYGRPAGILVSSAQKLGALPNVYGEGEVVFSRAQTEFAGSVAIPQPQLGVRGLLLDDGNIVSNDIFLVGTDGIVLSEEDGAIRVDIIGDPYALLKACESEGLELPGFCGLRTINYIPPDGKGDFKLTIGGNLAADNVLRVEQDEDGNLKIKAVGGSLSV